jgi:hypothetical protein
LTEVSNVPSYISGELTGASERELDTKGRPRSIGSCLKTSKKRYFTVDFEGNHGNSVYLMVWLKGLSSFHAGA